MLHNELALFLAHSLALESEARERYLELSESLAAHHNGDAAAFFQRMAREAEQHLEEVAELAADQALPQLQPWDYTWPGPEAPESASYEALHYRMSLGEAMHLTGRQQTPVWTRKPGAWRRASPLRKSGTPRRWRR